MNEFLRLPYGRGYHLFPEWDRYRRYGAEVLYGLKDPIGVPVGKQIVETVLTKPSIKRVVVFGPPGVGKTTILFQLARELEDLSGGQIKPVDGAYERVLELFDTRFGPRTEWSREVWDKFNTRLISDAAIPAQPLDGSFRRIEMFETVGVGKRVPRDRGVTAISEMAKETNSQSPGEVDTLYICGVPDPKLQGRSIRVRTLTLQQPNREVSKFLWDSFNIVASGPKSRSEFDILDEETRGTIIKFILARSAREEHITTINQEMLEEAERILRPTGHLRHIKQISIPGWLANLLPGYDKLKHNYHLIINYLEYKVKEELGLPHDRGYVVMNEFKPDRQIHWYIDNPTVRYVLAHLKAE